MLVRTVLDGDGEFSIVGEAANGDDGVRLAELHSPDVIVLDLAMPVRDGVETLVRIREQVPACKVLLLSGLTAEELAEEDLGADGYLDKVDFVRSLPRTLKQVCGGDRAVSSFRARAGLQ